MTEAKTTTMSTTLRAFNGTAAIKARYLARLEQHQERREFIQDEYVKGSLEDGTFRGSAVGCTVHSDQYAAFETELGIPIALALLEEDIFKCLRAAEASQFAIDFLKAIPVGADLSLIEPRFHHWLLMDEAEGVIRFAKTTEAVAVMRDVGELFSRSLAGETVERGCWKMAGDAAFATCNAIQDAEGEDCFSAEAEATYIAAHAAIPGGVADAAGFAATIISYITCAAPNAVRNAYAVANRTVRTKQAAKLLELLREAPTASGIT